MKIAVEVRNIEDLKKVLKYLDIEEDFNVVSEETWKSCMPMGYVKEEGEIFSAPLSQLYDNYTIIPPHLLGKEIKPYNIRRETKGYKGMSEELQYKIGSVHIATLICENWVYIPAYRQWIKLIKSTKYENINPGLTTNSIVEIDSPFGGIKENGVLYRVQDLGARTALLISLDKKSIQKRVPYVLLKHVREIHTKKPKKVEESKMIENNVDWSKKKGDIYSFYLNHNVEVDNDLLDYVKPNTLRKHKYLSFLFQNSLKYDFTDSKETALQYHADFKEMIEKLETLGFDRKKDRDGILNNKLFFNGKERKVTSILASQKLGRYDHVYKAWDNIFKDQTIELSIDPYDFVTASYFNSDKADELIESCFRVHGCYHTAVWAYMGTKEATILRIRNKNNKVDLRMWVTFDLKNQGIIFGRTYGHASKTQMKIIRLILEKKVADFLGVPNKWTYGKKEVRTIYGEGVYWDDPTGVAVVKETSNPLEVNFGDALNSSGKEADCGDFCASPYTCDCCGDRVDDTTYVEMYNEEVCYNCLQNYYVWSEACQSYIKDEDSIYIKDEDDYDSEDNADAYYEIDGCYYSEIPDGYTMAYDTDNVLPTDELSYCYFSEEYYEIGEDMETVYVDDDTHLVHINSIPRGYIYCEECGVYYDEDLDECPNCGHIIEREDNE